MTAAPSVHAITSLRLPPFEFDLKFNYFGELDVSHAMRCVSAGAAG